LHLLDKLASLYYNYVKNYEEAKTMTELEKIIYAKDFIDKLANGINPIDGTAVSDLDIVNNVRVSRCLFYVSELLCKTIELERKHERRLMKKSRVPLYVTPDMLSDFVASEKPVSATVLAKNINETLKTYIEVNNTTKLSYRKITQFLLNIGMIEYKDIGNGKMKRVPTKDGEEIGLTLVVWNNYGRLINAIFYNESAQRFIVDNIEAVINTEVKSGKTSYPFGTESADGDGE
jgi:hypothetical protein